MLVQMTLLAAAIAQIAGPPGSGHRDPPVRITVLYDNRSHRADLSTGWGFAAFVERGTEVVLFDTGGDGPTLLANAAKLGLDLTRASAVVLSHPHNDHTGGLAALLDGKFRPTVYVSPSFPESAKGEIRRATRLVEAGPGEAVAPGMILTGEVAGDVREQGLIVETPRGFVVLTGCAHPGVTAMVAAVKAVKSGSVDLVLGGFHLLRSSPADVEAVILRLRELGVRRVAPTHCTGDDAIARFRAAYGDDFVEAGVGQVLLLGDPGLGR
jgi:7,8-dihydropterin-6-yl-methyl-4-(beta-D-ribofuranosyl)aminobenzene 5'-phosphate synthase